LLCCDDFQEKGAPLNRRLGYGLGLIILMGFHVGLYSHTFTVKKVLDSEVTINYVLPVEFSRVAALDFQGLAADFQLLQGIFFIGEKTQQQKKLTDEEWDYFTRIIKTVTELDPYFYDTYHFSTGMLTWGAGRFQDAIDILENARQYNPNDFRFPYHIGFIYFYFLNDAQKGAQYLELASRIPDAPPLIASLASRLAYYKGNYQFSINLLERMLLAERSPQIRKYYMKRLEALKGALSIEKAVIAFKEEKSRMPVSLQELVDSRYLESIPQDPYGGEYILVEGGRVYSTSRFSETPNRENNKAPDESEKKGE
jgi:tetratricopeptide (TPR) repeat protein